MELLEAVDLLINGDYSGDRAVIVADEPRLHVRGFVADQGESENESYQEGKEGAANHRRCRAKNTRICRVFYPDTRVCMYMLYISIHGFGFFLKAFQQSHFLLY